MNTSVSPQTAQLLLQAIEQDCSLANTLKRLLQEEKSSLEQRQFVAHQTLVKQKTEHLMALEQADNERRKLLSEMGFATDKEGFDAFVRQVPKAWQQRFQNRWEELSDTMNTCSRLNKVNGKILAHAQSSIERLMTVIKGATSQVATYQANGRKSLANNHRMLVTA